MIWAGVPQTLELGIIDMLLSHLRSDKAPARQEIPRVWQPDAVSAQFFPDSARWSGVIPR
jgi:hypothetical protein